MKNNRNRIFAATIVAISSVIGALIMNTDWEEDEIYDLAQLTEFNGHAKDYPTLLLMNVSQKGSNNSEDWQNVVFADIGDRVSFNLYYHNSGPYIANDVVLKVSLQKCEGKVGCAKICGSINAKNLSRVVRDCGEIQVNDEVKISEVSDLHWRPAKGLGSSLLLNNQTGFEIWTDGGLKIGDVGTGWGDQGNVNGSIVVGRPR